MKRQFRDYQEKLLQDLQNPELASAYLNESLKDEDPFMFSLALKNIYKTHSKEMTALAKTHKLTRRLLNSSI